MLSDKYQGELLASTTGLMMDVRVPLGYAQLDNLLGGGLKRGCCYLFAGIEKSGKSTYLFNVISNSINRSTACGLISTEMNFADVIGRIMSVNNMVGGSPAETRPWRNKVNNFFSFYGSDELTIGGKYSFPKILKALDEMNKARVELAIIDNLTSLGAEAGGYKELGGYISQLFTYVKEKTKMAVIFVLHVKQDVVFKETPKGIHELVKSGKAEEVLTESVTIVSRPSLRDVYGGGQALSQITGGALFIWRPFQKFDAETFRKMGLIMVDTHRYGPSGQVLVEYNEKTGKVLEIVEGTQEDLEQLGFA